MKELLQPIFGAVATGLIWAALWAAVGALLRIVDSSGSLDRVWLGPAIGLFPGFVGGVLFSATLAIVARPRRFDQLSGSAVLACGAIVGFVLGVLPLAINKPPAHSPLWLVAAVVIGSMTLMGATSATSSLALARMTMAKRRQSRRVAE
jgi:hypothetical protein